MRFTWTKIAAVAGGLVGLLHPDNIFPGVGAIGFALPWLIFFAFIGFIVDLILRWLNKLPNPDTHVKCPDCKELVLRDARKCKHCGCNLISQ